MYSIEEVQMAQMETYACLLDTFSRYDKLINVISDDLVSLTFESASPVQQAYDRIKVAQSAIDNIASAFKHYAASHEITVQ